MRNNLNLLRTNDFGRTFLFVDEGIGKCPLLHFKQVLKVTILAIWMIGSYNQCNKVEDTMSRGTAIYSEKGKNG